MQGLDTPGKSERRSAPRLTAGRRAALRWRRDELDALDWQEFGSCRSVDQALFFAPDSVGEPAGERTARLMAAKRVCTDCPVRETCRSYALENGEEFGVWGGLSEIERKQLLAERRRAPRGEAWPSGR